MTERQFTIALTDAERLMVLTALGFVSMRVPPASHPWTVIDGLIAKVTHASVANERTPAGGESRTEFEHDRFGTAGPISGTGTARAVLAPPTPKDYFQPTKSGKAVTKEVLDGYIHPRRTANGGPSKLLGCGPSGEASRGQ